jgi:hypothetical protein
MKIDMLAHGLGDQAHPQLEIIHSWRCVKRLNSEENALKTLTG